MIQILYEADHLNRAKTLAEVTPNSAYDLVDTKATSKKVETLIFWGHSGGNLSLCSKSPQQIMRIVKEWKGRNSKLKTVEILTCDGRHAKRGEKPLALKVKNALRKGIRSSTRNVTVKALPVGVHGRADAASILLADWETKSWCYIAAPSLPVMGQVKHKIETIALKFYRLRPDDTSAADVAEASQRLFKQRGEENRQYSINYGYFNTLRAHLGVVHSKDFTTGDRLHKIE